MPTYEYVCGACKHHWEAFQSIKEEPLTECPKCRKPKARRQISAGTGFILKGGGWYSDLYASPKAEKADSKTSEGSTSGEAAKGDSAKSESSKSETKTESKDKGPKDKGKKSPSTSK